MSDLRWDTPEVHRRLIEILDRRRAEAESKKLTKHSRDPWKCMDCGARFATLAEISNHLDADHPHWHF